MKRIFLSVAAAFGLGSAFAALPSGYTAVEYIESTGVQRIRNFYSCSANTTLELDFTLTSGGTASYFGASYSGNNWLFINREGAFMLYGNNSNNGIGNGAHNGDEYYLKLQQNEAVLTNKTDNLGWTKSGVNMGPTSGTKSVYLFGDNGTGRAKYRLHWIRVYESGELVRNCLPCYTYVDTVKTAGLYDTLTDTFYANGESGDDFVLGAETEDILHVKGSPADNEGVPTCGSLVGYGHRALAPGEAVIAAVAEPDFETDTAHWTLLGWQLEQSDGETTEITTNTSANVALCEFTHTGGELVTLTWLWKKGPKTKLPDGYVPVEYIRSTGVQYLKNVYTCKSTSRIETDFRIDDHSGSTALYGGSWNRAWLLQKAGSITAYGGGEAVLATIVGDTYHTVMTYSSLAVTNCTRGTGAVKTVSGGMGGNNTIGIFAVNDGGNKTKYTLFGMQIYEGDELVRDFRPCYTYVDTVKTAGLYDLVNSTFYTNAGTGADFVTGPATDDYLTIAGSPVEVGTMSGTVSGYGACKLTDGQSVTVTMNETSVTTEKVVATLKGWKLAQKTKAGVVTETVSTAANFDTCSYTHNGTDHDTLVWLWSVEYLPVVPDGYQPVEYIQSTGAQYIKNAFSGTPTTRVELDFQLDVAATGGAAIFAGTWGDGWLLQINGNFTMWGRGTYVGTGYAGDTYHSVHTATWSVMTNLTKGTSSSGTYSTIASATVALFGVNNSTSYKSKYKLYKAKVYDQGEYGEALVRYFVPCCTNDGTTVIAGLYDVVNEKFYRNSATTGADFTLGPVSGNYLYMVGEPGEYGEPVSGSLVGYGGRSLTTDEAVVCTMPETVVDVGAQRATLLGWTLAVKMGDVVVSNATSTAANFDRCAFTHRKGAIETVTWRWKVENRVVVSADDGLVATADKSIAVVGETVTVNVRENGAKFHSWSGSVSGLDVFSTNLTLVVTGAMSFVAHAVGRDVFVAPGESIQAALDEAVAESYPAIYFEKGLYPIDAAVSNLAAATPIRFVGSDEGETVLARTNSAIQTRILDLSGLTASFDRLTISNGYWSALTGSTVYGQGVRLLNGCTALFADCTFVKNGNGNQSGNSESAIYQYGGAIGAKDGILGVTRCRFIGNSLHSSGEISPLGGAIGANGTSVRLVDSQFVDNNEYWSNARPQGGGALGLISPGWLEIIGCAFTSNWCKRGGSGSGNQGVGSNYQHGPYGGAIYVSGCAKVSIRDSVFRANWNPTMCSDSSLYPWGGSIYLKDCTSAIVRTVVIDGGHSPFAATTDAGKYCNGSVDIHGGTLSLTNFLSTAAHAGWCVGNRAGTVEAVNCTFAGTKGNSDQPAAAYVQYSGTATFADCLFWDLKDGTYSLREGDAPTFVNCLIDVDPLFGDDVYCHPRSAAGRYDGGWFSGGSWVTDSANSPAIDKGTVFVTDASLAEPQPNGRSVNCGYDGNTTVASKSVLGSDPVVTPGVLTIFAYGRTVPNATGATVYGDLAEAGAASTTARVTMVWGKTDAGTSDVAAWEHAVDCGYHAPWDLVTTAIDGDFTGKVYYRFVATDGASATAWSDPVRTYTMATPPELAYDTDAQPVSHLYRTSAKVRLDVLSSSDIATEVFVTYTPDGGESLKTYAVRPDPAATGKVAVDLTGLLPGTSYTFTATASNAVGGVTLAEKSFTTVANDEPLALVAGTEATGLGDGSGFGDATTLDAALAQTTKAGDEVRLLGGVYTVADLLLSGHPGLVLRGGYGTDGTPYAETTTWSGNLLANHQILKVSASTVTLDGITFTHGRMGTESHGQAVGSYSSSNLIITNCVFVDNGDACINGARYGGAVGAKGGVLTVTDCVFTNNAVFSNNGNNVVAIGGAIGATDSATVTVRGCRFSRNYLRTDHQRNLFGGAIGCSGCARLTVEDCRFFRNGIYTTYTYGGDWRNDNEFYGGAIYAETTPTVLKDLFFDGDYCASCSSLLLKYWEFGGTCCFKNSTVSGVNLEIRNAGDTDRGNKDYATGSIFVWGSSAKVALTNVLNAGAVAGNLFAQAGGSLEVVNGTFADAQGGGKRKGSGYFQCTNVTGTATATFKNCIFWNNADGFLGHTNVAYTIDATYSDIEGASVWPGTGNINANPKFTDDYSLRSSSRCVNSGTPGGSLVATDLAGNPRIRNLRIDMGCYEADKPGLLILVK